MRAPHRVPRWQQGPRPGAWGDVWDRMTPEERRRSFFWDLVIAVVGVALVALVFS